MRAYYEKSQAVLAKYLPISAAVAIAYLASLSLAHAQSLGLEGVPAPEGTVGGSDLPGVIINILNSILVLAGVIALLYIILGGIKYITSGGDEDAISAAKNTILYTIIGLIVIGVSAVAVNFIIQQVIGGGIS